MLCFAAIYPATFCSVTDRTRILDLNKLTGAAIWYEKNLPLKSEDPVWAIATIDR
jgi:hypothetical protein